MNELQIFENEEFGSVRTVMIDGDPWFVANDVAKALGYARPADAVSAHCKGSVKRRYLTKGGEQDVKMIPEGDLYRLIIRSKLESAERFEKWLFDEVVPTIRKTGGYHLPQTYAEALRALADESEKAEKLKAENVALLEDNEMMKPKAEFFDAVTDSTDAIDMKDTANALHMGIGRNKLFEFLRNKNILTQNNRPYQQYIDRGYFRVIEQKYEKPYGEAGINIKTIVYQSGVDFIRKKLIEAGY